MPKDLVDLVNRWNTLQKQEGFVSLASGPQEQTHPDTFDMTEQLWNEIESFDTEKKSQLKSVGFKRLEKNVRSKVLKHILPAESSEIRFCAIFPTKIYKPKAGEELNEEKLKQAQMRYNRSNCRKLTSDALGGILHTNPTTYLLKTTFGGLRENSEIIFYVQSIVDPTKYLRYHFSI